MMEIHLITPFEAVPKMYLQESIMRIAEKKGLVEYSFYNLFDYADSPHHRIDDYPFGGGAGMVLRPEPVFRALDQINNELSEDIKLRVVYPTPDGEQFNHDKALNLSRCDNLVFINGHYKGIDQRIRDELVTDEVSIGDYVLTGGEKGGPFSPVDEQYLLDIEREAFISLCGEQKSIDRIKHMLLKGKPLRN